MGNDIFISYASKDKAVADAACAKLEAPGLRCWIAPRDILPGEDWGAAIIDAIADTRVMLLILSSGANASNQIKREVERAVHHSVAVLPLRIEDVAPSKALEYFISTPHWLDAITPPLSDRLDEMTRTVARLLEKQMLEVADRSDIAPLASDRPSSSHAPSSPSRLSRRRNTNVALAVAVILLGVAAGLTIARRHSPNSPTEAHKLTGGALSGFQPPAKYNASIDPTAVPTTRSSSATTRVWSSLDASMRRGLVRFAAAAQYHLTDDHRWFMYPIVLADFNGDGKTDIAGDSGGGGFILLNRGNGTFEEGRSTPLLSGHRQFVAADFNRDARADFAILWGKLVDVYLNTGNGRSWKRTFSCVESGLEPAGVVSAAVACDFNHDGNLDIASINLGGVVGLFLGNGDGTFQPPTHFPGFLETHEKGFPSELFAGDFNGDGKMDLLVSSYQGPTAVLFGDGNGKFSKPKQISADRGPYDIVAVADLNKDGVADIALAQRGTAGGLRALLSGPSQADGIKFKEVAIANIQGSGAAIGDFNGDGIPDFVFSDASQGRLWIILGRGDGTFEEPFACPQPVQEGKHVPGGVATIRPWGIYAADLNGDGLADLVLINWADNSLSIMLNESKRQTSPPKP